MLRFIAIFALILTGCQSATLKEKKASLEDEAEIELQISNELTAQIEKKYGTWKNPKAEEFLSSLSLRMMEKNADLKNEKPKFVLLNTPLPFFVPGLKNIVYLSKGALASCQYENELAYMVAFSLIMIKENVPKTHIFDLKNQQIENGFLVLPTAPNMAKMEFLDSGWFEPRGAFDFGYKNYQNADQKALKAMQAARYDHRGAASLYKRWMQPSYSKTIKAFWKLSPSYEERAESIRIETAKITPIRDPIIKSRKFNELKDKVGNS